jgi:hypothetical protein
MPTLDGSVKSKTIPIRTRQGETIDFVDVSQSVGGTIYGTTPGDMCIKEICFYHFVTHP